MIKNLDKKETKRIENLYKRVVGYISSARSNILRSVDSEQLQVYWQIGRDIVEEEQAGESRAHYGSFLLEELSLRLTKELGKGLGRSTLADIRKFYITYSKVHAVRGQSEMPKFKSNLGWTHYRALMRVANEDARAFYEIEANEE